MKQKKKLKKIIISVSIFLAVVLGIGTIGFYAARDYIFAKLLESYVEDEMMNSLGLDLEEAAEAEPSEIQTAAPSQTAENTQKEEITLTEEASDDSKAKTNQTNDNPRPITKEEIKKVVKEKAKAINEAIPSEDKAEISALVLDNLSQEDISSLAGLAADGISQSDIEKAKELAKSRFSEDQMAEVYGYYKQYKDAVLN